MAAVTLERLKTLPVWEGGTIRASAGAGESVAVGDTVTLDGVTATVTAKEHFTSRWAGKNLQQVRLITDLPQEPASTAAAEAGWKPNKFAGKCCSCGCSVAAGAGTLYSTVGQGRRLTGSGVGNARETTTQWRVICLPCAEREQTED